MKRIAQGLIVFAVFGGVAALHTHRLRSLAARLGGCPVTQTTVAQVEQVREHGLATLRGGVPAPARSALGLSLDATVATEAEAWTRRHGLTCETSRRGFDYLTCSNVSAAAVNDGPGQIDELTLAFGAANRLVGVDALRRNLKPATATVALTEIRARLRRQLGEPTDESGEISAANLGGGALHTVVMHWRFRDYLASVVATALPWSGIVIHEQYSSAKPAIAAR